MKCQNRICHVNAFGDCSMDVDDCEFKDIEITSERLQELEDHKRLSQGKLKLQKATIKELTADKERLDWLEDMLSDCMLSLTESHIEDKENWLLSEKFGFATPRQAIDKARKGEKD